MARYSGSDGMLAVWHVPTVANIAAPTVAEIGAGTKLSPHMDKTGVKVPTGQNMVPDDNLEDTFDAQVIGSWGGSPLTFVAKRNNASGGTDTVWNLITYGLAGYIVIRRGVTAATAVAASQPVEVYPVQYHHPIMEDPATNTQARFTVTAAVTATPNMKAVIA